MITWTTLERFGVPAYDPPYVEMCRRCGERVGRPK